MTFKCLKPGCPTGCGTRRRPACADRVLCRVLFLMLAAVLALSLATGVRELNTVSEMAIPAITAPAVDEPAVDSRLDLHGALR